MGRVETSNYAQGFLKEGLLDYPFTDMLLSIAIPNEIMCLKYGEEQMYKVKKELIDLSSGLCESLRQESGNLGSQE